MPRGETGTPGVNTATAGPSFDKKLSQFRSSILFGQKSMQFFHISIVVWILAKCWDNRQARTGFVGNVGNARWYWSCEFKDIFSYRNFMILKFSLECIGLYSCRYLDILQARTDCTKWCQMKWHWKVGGAREPEGGGWRWWWWWLLLLEVRDEKLGEILEAWPSSSSRWPKCNFWVCWLWLALMSHKRYFN